jgi:hypothetical protein
MRASSGRRWVLLAAVAATAGCGDPQLFLGLQTHELRGAERVLLEDACVLVMGERGPMDLTVTRRLFAEGAAMPDDIAVERAVEDFSLSVTITDGSQGFSQMDFRAFFDDEQVVHFEHVSGQGRTYRFMHRSVFECDAPLLPADSK